MSWFLKGTEKPRPHFANMQGFVDEIGACKGCFRFALADLGPREAFADYNILRDLVRMLRAVDFTPRLLTTARHFADLEVVQQQFIELVQLGVSRIILRVDRKGAESLSQSNLDNYIKGCLASGIVPEVRLDLDDPVSEAFFDLVRRIEQVSFYTTIRPKAPSNVQRETFDPAKPIRLGTNSMRIVISEGGAVLLREYGHRTTETYLGSLLKMQLPAIIDPIRVGYGGGGALT